MVWVSGDYLVKQYKGWFIYEIADVKIATKRPALLYIAPLSQVEAEIDKRNEETRKG